ncbi:hypothetical protein SXCC_01854 [Gluconacetobacter sp. SXCC-1]|nr:hypothetical protein SXCC_01854 [Gluconacetobacter sp. SXCC-1]
MRAAPHARGQQGKECGPYGGDAPGWRKKKSAGTWRCCPLSQSLAPVARFGLYTTQCGQTSLQCRS